MNQSNRIVSLLAVILVAGVSAVYLGSHYQSSTVTPQTQVAQVSGGTTYYVSPNGNDSNSGLTTSAPKTLRGAAGIVNPGDTVILMDGVYPAVSGDATVIVRRSGTASGWITFKAQHKGAAILDGVYGIGSSAAGTEAFWFPDGISYVAMRDMEIRNFSEYGINITHVDSNFIISGNNIHDIARQCISGSGGGYAGIELIQINNVTITGNIVHDNGRLLPGEPNPITGQVCYPTDFDSAEDHGIYLSSGDAITITNNVFYNNKSGWDVHVYHWQDTTTVASHVVIANNTFATTNAYRQSNNPGQLILARNGVVNATIVNNIFYSPAGQYGIYMDDDGLAMQNVTISNNIVYGGHLIYNPGRLTGYTSSNEQEGIDPKLTNPTTVPPNVHLTSASTAAIDKGVMISAVTPDLDGTPRPQGSAYDIGAYEYNGVTNPTYTISASAGAGGSISPSGSISVNRGGSQSFTITPNSGYQVSLVTIDGTSQGAITSYTFTNIQSAHTISATFSTITAQQTYTVTITPPTNGYVTDDMSLVNCGTICTRRGIGVGQPVTLTAHPNSGYVTSSWTGCQSSSGNTCSFVMNADANVSVSFSPIQSTTYSVTITPPTNGYITDDLALVNCGTICTRKGIGAGQPVTLTAHPNSGYVTSSWTGCQISSGDACSLTMNADANVSVSFSPIQSTTYTVTITPPTNGYVTDDMSLVNCGTICTRRGIGVGQPVTLTAHPNSGYVTSSWTGCQSSSGNTCSFVMNADANVSVSFSAPQLAIVLSAPVSGTAYKKGSTATISAATAGIVSSVKFYISGTLIATDTSAPYTTQYALNNIGLYTITAVASNGTQSVTSAPVSISVQTRFSKPPTVTSLTATAGSVVLHWTPVSYAYLDHYAIFRSTTGYPSRMNSILATTTGISYHDINVLPKTTYYYTVYAVDSNGIYSDPAYITYTTPTSPDKSPSTPNWSLLDLVVSFYNTVIHFF